MKTVLTIAGTDPSGGAGLHADLKTFCAHGIYGMGVITAVVAQNTSGVFEYDTVRPKLLTAQLEAVFSDIFPDAVKIGMLPDIPSIEAVATALEKWKPKQVILDPVMVSTSDHRLQREDAARVMVERLFPRCELVTPNLAESETLCGFPVTCRKDAERAARFLRDTCGTAVLITGGHLQDSCDDLLYDSTGENWFPGKRIATSNTHGTGCTLSAAIAANRAAGDTLPEAVRHAKEYVFRALSCGLRLGKGNGPLDHCSAVPKGI